MSIPNNITMLTPWEAIGDKRAELLSAELQREIPAQHVLHGLKVRAVAARVDVDDVLFEVEGGPMPLAVVHVTWQRETNPIWPGTTLFGSWEEWVQDDMLPNHRAAGE